MKYTLRIPLCCALLLSCTTLVTFGQKRACPKPPPSPYKHDALITTTYDKVADKMRTTLEHPRILGKEGDRVYLSASFTHEDPRRPVRPSIEITLIAVSVKPRYEKAHDLTILTDGKRWMPAGAAQYRAQTNSSGSVFEATKVTLTYDDLLGIIKAKIVEARLGLDNFQLSENHLESLRELASLITPAAHGWSARRE